MLPISSPTSPNGRPRLGSSSSKQTWKFLRRLYKFKLMDFQYAAWQMLYLFTAPSKVYKNFHYHSETKHQWARDDPAFFVLVAVLVFVSSIIYALILRYSFGQFILHLLWLIFFDYIAMAFIIATGFWYCVNKFLRKPECHDQFVEWRYSFDVHLNAFLPLLVILHILQVLFMTNLLKSYLLGRIISNTMWFIAVAYYFYITFLGYFSLPFTQRTTLFLYPIAAFGVVFILSLVFKWHFSLALRYFVTWRVRAPH